MTEYEWLEKFSHQLRDIMTREGYTERGLAKATGLSKSAIGCHKQGHHMPRMLAAINMSYELNVDIDEFIDFGEDVELDYWDDDDDKR